MDPESWNQFVLENGPRSGRFLQSWEWGEFQKSIGQTVIRESFEQDGKVHGIAQWIEQNIPVLGNYRFCPKGPIGEWEPRATQPIFLRIEPSHVFLRSHKTRDINPAYTRITDLSMSEQDLLNAMHPKTRYNIRVAQKHGIKVRFDTMDFASAWPVFLQTASRGEFRLHEKTYYEHMLASLSKTHCRAFLATAQQGGTLIAANLMIDFGDTRTYLHGGSSNEHRNLMAPYLLHFELMRDAKSKGLLFYDWWGVAPPDAVSTHSWTGISRFKRGFPGVEYASVGTCDIVLNPMRYSLYKSARSLARYIRTYV